MEVPHTHKQRQIKIVSLSSLTWFFAGFDFILLPLLAKEIGSAFFPNIDPTNTILAVFGVFSLSLLARVFGGIFFGRIADEYGQRPVIIISLMSITVLMFVSAILPGVHGSDNIIFVPVLFTLTRLGIGFFVGALWPICAMFGMERLHEKCQGEWAHENNSSSGSQATKKNDAKQATNDPRKLTIQSAFMQLGFHAGGFLSVFFVFIFLEVCSSHCDVYFHFLNTYFKDAFVWRTMCIIGGLFGIFWSIIFWKETKNDKNEKENGEQYICNSIDPSTYDARAKKGILIALLTDVKYKEYRKTLFNFWLIFSGLMYMYYSNLAILPEMFIRDDLLFPFSLGNRNGNYPFVLILFMVSIIGAHIWLGFYCRDAWKKKEKSKLVAIPLRLREWYWCFSRRLSILIGFGRDEQPPTVYRELLESTKAENVDLLVIISVGLLIIMAGVIGVILFYFTISLQSTKDIYIYLMPVMYTLIPVSMLNNSGWALMPSMLSSRFPVGIRNTCATLVYNGGLVIGFASPFIILEFYLRFKCEYIIFIPMILGALAMIRGAAHFINDTNTQSEKKRRRKEGWRKVREDEKERWWIAWVYTAPVRTKSSISNLKFITSTGAIVWITVIVIVIAMVLLMPLRGEDVLPELKNQSFTTSMGANITIPLIEGVSIVEKPEHGNLSRPTSNGVSYTPSAGFSGNDNFTFKVVKSYPILPYLVKNTATAKVFIHVCGPKQHTCLQPRSSWPKPPTRHFDILPIRVRHS
jgi:MFS family permease